ncbi:hypothetical protein [Streptomyces nitrosporeus]|uniref:hypothetical protein n=1 Tax=Streptomyces nitrosporeus TaxID=28894 RepID=UPI00167EFA9B|nr:hypothetical protein [Streptomyces nitrosporeus]GGZ27829.1 hypothetical protein GCM10010327_67800 [Streptomyces nitrosporeus]
MSYQGQTWVDEVALPQLQNAGELIVMLRVANHAGNGPRSMSGCFVSSGTLAAECLLKERAVQGHLRELARRGLLVPGDPKLVAHIRADRRPPVYDLAGAHDPGCPGEHDVDAECLSSTVTGGKNCYPSTDGATGGRKNHPSGTRRSAGGRKNHPSDEEAVTGSKKRRARVANFATESSKEFKDLSLSAEAGGEQQASGAPDASEEREIEGQDNTGGLAVAEALAAQWRAVHGTSPGQRQLDLIAADAVSALAAGDVREWLVTRVVPFMVARRYLDLGRAKTHPQCPPPAAAAVAPAMCPKHPHYPAGKRCVPCVMA